MQRQKTIHLNGRIMDLQRPKIMGILNVTPDSFYKGSRVGGVHDAVEKALQMKADGVDILDVGGMSSRPGAKIITAEEEISRVIPVIEKLVKVLPDVPLSLDTVWSETAKAGVEVGAAMINDISAGSMDEQMFETVAKLDVPYVLMHMRGKPTDMQNDTDYNDINLEVLDFLIKKHGELLALGVKDVIIDPGFGFGKSIEGNYELLKNLEQFFIMDAPVLVGVSRKSMLWKLLDSSPKEVLSATSALHLYALQKGAQILRVHDVKEAVEVRTMFELLK